jgi:hypothetical protein
MSSVKGQRWLHPRSFADCNTLLSPGLIPLLVCSSSWQTPHGSGISSILGSLTRSSLHFHSFSQWPPWDTGTRARVGTHTHTHTHDTVTVIRHHDQRRQIITWDLQLQRDWSPSPSWQVAWQQAGRHNTRGAAESSHCETQPWGRENPGKRGGFWNLRVGLQWHTSSSPS